MIPQPTLEDRARDAQQDWDDIHSTFKSGFDGKPLLPGKCPTEWVLAYIRRAVAAEAEVTMLREVLAKPPSGGKE